MSHAPRPACAAQPPLAHAKRVAGSSTPVFTDATHPIPRCGDCIPFFSARIRGHESCGYLDSTVGGPQNISAISGHPAMGRGSSNCSFAQCHRHGCRIVALSVLTSPTPSWATVAAVTTLLLLLTASAGVTSATKPASTTGDNVELRYQRFSHSRLVSGLLVRTCWG